jgi:hypothetical protein
MLLRFPHSLNLSVCSGCCQRAFSFAPALPVSPPPLPAVFFEDHSAKISAAAESLIKERTTELESRERLLLAREQQLQELELLIRDRERICLRSSINS